MLLGEILKSVTGDDGYPGDTATSEHWPGVAPGTRGILNALSPKYCNWAGIVDLDPKPPILWTHGAHDIVVADGSPWEMGTLGSLGAVPGLAGRGRLPAAADGGADPGRAHASTRRAVGACETECSRSPATSRRWTRASAGARGSSASWSRVKYAAPGSCWPITSWRSRSTTRDPHGEQITIFAREVAEPEGRDKPFLVYLQGGPGFEAPRPTGNPRGPVLAGPRAEGLPRAAARPARDGALDAGAAATRPPTYLTHFRADSIVRDAERLRAALGVAAVERARPELRRAVRAHVPVDRPGGPARGVDHRRRARDRRAGRRRLPRDVRARARAQPPLLRALPAGPRAGARARAAARREDVRLPNGDR